MKLLMISGDRSLASGKHGAFFSTLEELSKHFERIDIITPRIDADMQTLSFFDNIAVHPSPRGLWYQPCWIWRKGSALHRQHGHDCMTVHEYPPFYNGIGAMVLHCRTKIPYSIEIHHLVGEPHASSWSEWIGSMMNKVFLRFDAWCARKVRVVNGTVRKQLMRRGIPEDKITLVPSFYLDAQKLTPDATIAKSFDLVTACRLVKNKNIDALLDVLVNLPMLRLLIIGDGPERAALEIRARKISLSSRITFAGWLPTADDVYRAMQRGRVFVMPSRSEGGPRALLEAIALKLPVVTTDVGIAPDIVALTHGRFTTGTSADLTQKIDDILAHPPHDSDLAEASVRIFAMYERTKAIKAYADFLSSLSQ